MAEIAPGRSQGKPPPLACARGDCASRCLSRPPVAAQDGPVNFPTKISPSLCALALTLLVGACSPSVPTAARGTVDFYRDGKMTSARALVEKEARAVAAWITAHSSGWSRNHASEAPAIVIRLKHSNFDTTVINLSGNTLIVSNSGSQFRRTLSPQEEADFRLLAGIGPASAP